MPQKRSDKEEKDYENDPEVKKIMFAVAKVVDPRFEHQENLIKGIESKVVNLESHVNKTITSVIMGIITSETHNRKCNIVVNGLKGEANEPSHVTRTKILDLGSAVFNNRPYLTACHRLKRSADSGIIVAFSNLDEHDLWLSKAKQLGPYNEYHGCHVSFQQDLPIPLRQCKDNLLSKRKTLPADEKRGSYLKYLPKWPFVKLAIKGKPALEHPYKREEIAKKWMDLYGDYNDK